MRKAARTLCRLACFALAAGIGCAAPGMADQEAPRRVVSINLCTDQLAMMLAAEGQLHSVSFVAQDPRVSAMVEEAKGYVANHGLAEEIYLMQPDLVLAGPYTTRATTAMLQRLGIPVVVIPATSTLEGVRDRLREMGEALHRAPAAETMIADFDRRLKALRHDLRERPEAVLYHANGYTSGEDTLAGQILLAAGFDNAAIRAGYGSGMKIPLEVLAMTAPDLVITSRPYPGASRSEGLLKHPVLQAIGTERTTATMTDHDWVCGTPYVLRAVEGLVDARREIMGNAR